MSKVRYIRAQQYRCITPEKVQKVHLHNARAWSAVTAAAEGTHWPRAFIIWEGFHNVTNCSIIRKYNRCLHDRDTICNGSPYRGMFSFRLQLMWISVYIALPHHNCLFQWQVEHLDILSSASSNQLIVLLSVKLSTYGDGDFINYSFVDCSSLVSFARTCILSCLGPNSSVATTEMLQMTTLSKPSIHCITNIIPQI